MSTQVRCDRCGETAPAVVAGLPKHWRLVETVANFVTPLHLHFCPTCAPTVLTELTQEVKP